MNKRLPPFKMLPERPRWFFSLHSKLLAVVLLFTILLTLSLEMYYPREIEERELQVERERNLTVWNVAAFGLSESVFARDTVALEKAVQRLALDPELVYVVVSDTSNRRLVSVDYESALRLRFKEPSYPLKPGPELQVLKHEVPIIYRGQEVGRLHLGFSLERVQAHVRQANATIRGLSAGILLLGVALALAVAVVVARPLRELARTAERISQGETSKRAAVASRDEIGLLARAFNRMVDELESEAGRVRANEERLRMLAEGTEDLIVMQNTNGQYVYYNANPRYGLTAEEVEGKTPTDLFDPSIAKSIMDRFKSIVETGQSATAETKLHWQGQTRWFHDHSYPIRDKPGNVIAVGTISRDITDLKAMEEALRRSEESLRIAQRIGKLGSWELHLSDGSMRWSEQTYHIFGRDPNEFHPSEESFLEAVHPDDRYRVQTVLLSGEDPWHTANIEHRILLPDGAVRYVSTFAEVAFDRAAKPIRVLGSVQDITERKMTENRLRESEENLRLALNAADMGTWSWNVQTNDVLWSEDVERLFGMKKSDFDGTYKTYLSRIHPVDRPRVEQAIYDCLFGRRDEYQVNHRMRWSDGSLHWLEGRGRVYHDSDGRPLRIAGTIAEVTRRKRAEDAIESILRGTSTATGEEFFRSLARELCRALNVTAAIVGKLARGVASRMQTLAVMQRGSFLDNFEYDLEGTPCAEVLGKEPRLFGRGIQGLFPDNTLFKTLKAESYFGFPVFSATREALGMIAILDEQPMTSTDLASTLLTIFAARAGAEIERIQAEEQSTMLAHAVTSVTECISIADKDSKLVFVNDAFLQTYGYRQDEVLGRTTDLVRSPINDARLLAEVRSATRSRGWKGELINRRRDGTDFPVYLSTSVIRDANGTVTAKVGIASDITERKQRERALRESEERYRKLFNEAIDGIVLVDAETGILIDCNEAFVRLVGREKSELIGRLQKILHHPLLEEPAVSETIDLHRSLIDGELHETQIVTSGGEIRDVEIQASAIELGGRKILQGMFRDITERKRAQEAIEHLRHQHELILNSAGEGIFGLDLKGNHTFVNQAAAKMLGYDTNELIGQHGHTRWHHSKPDGRIYAEDDCPICASLQDGTVHQVTDEVFCRREGTRFPVEYVSTPIWERNRLVGAVVVFRDITERKRGEEELNRSRLQLQRLSEHLDKELEEERKRISREIHDELGQLLTILKFDLSWIKLNLAEEAHDVRGKVDAMMESVGQALASVKRISRELRPPQLEALGLSGAIQWDLDQLENKVGIHTSVRIHPSDLSLDNDRSVVLYRVFHEALTNIMRHARATRVSVELERSADAVILRVQDNGRGIRKNELEGTTSLGLVGMRERVRPWNGKLVIAGKRGKGTTVTVEIPVESATPGGTES